MAENLNELTAHELVEIYGSGKACCGEVVESVFARIESVDDKVKAFLSLDKEKVLQQAGEVDEKIARGDKLRPLEGVPIALKDNLCLRGGETTCASKILKGFVAPYDCSVGVRLKEAGALVIGKTNLDEFAMGSSTENSAFKVTANPWDTSRVPGGSSGGSAAAVAADETILALGSDTGGSIRQPASLCGIVGLKPTYGRVSRYGLVAFASSLDQIGPMAKDVEDAALLLGVIAGHDARDSTSADTPVPDYCASLKDDATGLTLGVPVEYFEAEGLADDVRQAVETAVDTLRDAGATIKQVSLPQTKYAVPVYYIIANAEASANLARYDGVKYGYRSPNCTDLMSMYKLTKSEGFGDEVKRRIMLGTYALSSGYYDAYYLQAQKVRTLFCDDFRNAFAECDAILAPTSPTPSFKIGEKTDNPLEMYLLDIYTISANLGGLPAISVPCGFSNEGLPIGLQVMAKPFAEETVFHVASAYERNATFERRKPPLSAGGA